MQQPQQHPNLPSWQFLVQAINDFAATLAPSARSAFEAVAQHHVAQLTPVVMAPLAEPVQAPDPAARRDTQKGDVTPADPAQTAPAT